MNSLVALQSLQGNDIILLMVCFALLMLLSFVSRGEDAIFSIIPNRLKELKTTPDPRNNILAKLLESPQILKASILILKNLLYLGILLSLSFALNEVFVEQNYSSSFFLFHLALVIFVIFVFRDLVVKIIPPASNLHFARISARPFHIIHKILYPISCYLVDSTTLIRKKLLKRRNLTLDEISDALNLSSNEIQEDKNILKEIGRAHV